MRNTDIILLIPLLWGTCRGFYKGLISQITSLVGIVVVLYFSAKYYTTVANLINTHIESKLSQTYISIAAFIILFVAIFILIFLLSKQLEKIIKAIHMGFINKLAGGLFGLLKWIFIEGVIILLINRFGQEVNHPLVNFHATWLYNHIEMIASFIMPEL